MVGFSRCGSPSGQDSSGIDADVTFWPTPVIRVAYQDREVEMYWLKEEPPFETLRSDSRWQVMLDKVGFLE